MDVDTYFALLPPFELVNTHYGISHNNEWLNECYEFKIYDSKSQHLEQYNYKSDDDYRTSWALNGVFINYNIFRTIKYLYLNYQSTSDDLKKDDLKKDDLKKDDLKKDNLKKDNNKLYMYKYDDETKADKYFASLPSFDLTNNHSGLIHDDEWENESYNFQICNFIPQHLEQYSRKLNNGHITRWHLNNVCINYDTFRTIKYYCRLL